MTIPHVENKGGFCVALRQPNKERHHGPHKVLASLGYAIYSLGFFPFCYPGMYTQQ